jgi:hypothetical protein
MGRDGLLRTLRNVIGAEIITANKKCESFFIP